MNQYKELGVEDQKAAIENRRRALENEHLALRLNAVAADPSAPSSADRLAAVEQGLVELDQIESEISDS